MVRFGPGRFDPRVVVRGRRVRCKGCGVTATIQPEGVAARRKDAARVLLAALRARAAGLGFRSAADIVDRACSTVRNWFRAADQDRLPAAVLAAAGA
jgi:transposase-like protein